MVCYNLDYKKTLDANAKKNLRINPNEKKQFKFMWKVNRKHSLDMATLPCYIATVI